MDRAAGNGYWKPTGVDQEVKCGDGSVALKKSLDFYEGKHPDGKRTMWKMYEYRFDKEDDKRAPQHKKWTSGSKLIILVLYVDDILLASSDMHMLHETKTFMSKNINMKDLGEASYIIGIEIHRDRSRGIMGLSQRAYIDKILKRFSMHNCALTVVPIVKGDKFSLLQCPRNQLEQDEIKCIPYASALTQEWVIGKQPRKSCATYKVLSSCSQKRPISWKTAKQSLVDSHNMEAELWHVLRLRVMVYG
ncbi:hypothetical protein RJ640_007001 [Escallonia rubra]|uniref:NAC domain-containing protein n=1 Tax=Escallonia rubra TaxID=112253 RepID=A0AA88UE98_9ASTE|nr:hypothetical protein RJ640_007001 [Escallonia rubra]